MKLALGTVQFGMDYGRFNAAGRVAPDEVARILDLAHDRGIDALDTAQAYGDCEALLGRFGAGRRFRIVTKIAAGTECSAHELRERVLGSLARLGTERVHGVLLHDAERLEPARLALALGVLRELREAGSISRFGLSVYDPASASEPARSAGIDLVQLPLNLLDQRALAPGCFEELKAAGVEIHARSVYLQGLLLRPPEALTPEFALASETLARLHRDARDARLSPEAAALGFVLGVDAVDRVLVGVQSARELETALTIADAPLATLPYASYALTAPGITNPALWPEAASHAA